MAAAAELRAPGEYLELLDAVVYGDIFECAVTLDELHRYARTAIERAELGRLISENPVLRRVVVERDGLYCLVGRSELLGRRPSRAQRARTLQRRARRVARVLRHAPFVAGLLLTGSASADDATEGADVDLLVIVTPGRIGTVFLLLGSLSRVVGRGLLCPNWYLSVRDLRLPPRSPYLARELAQARSLAGSGRLVWEANPWISDWFPNAAALSPTPTASLEPTPIQRLLETALGGPLGDRVEDLARRLAARRLRVHYAKHGQSVPATVAASLEAGTALTFHGCGYEVRTSAAYAAQRADVLARLERVQQQQSRPVTATACPAKIL